MDNDPGAQRAAPDIQALRDRHYNATIAAIREIHEHLRIFRIRPDGGPLVFVPGQYTSLGLGHWEPSVADGRLTTSNSGPGGLIRRAYSFSSPILNEEGQLVHAGHEDLLEFYIVLASAGADHPPGLTPRLFALSAGDRLHIGTRPKGNYTLASVRPDDDIVFAATGTGEAPHNVMLAQLLATGHRGRILSLVSVRYRMDLAYVATHRELERRYSGYRFLALTTREPQNVDPHRADYIGKQYVQQFLSGPQWKTLWGEVDPQRTHVFACGNPGMIGIPHIDREGNRLFPEPPGLIELLEQRGFCAGAPRRPGNLHYEKFW